MEANGEISLNRLRESVRKLGSSTEGHGEETLMRFLIARSMDSDKAAKMFVKWRKWRASMVPGGFLPESEVQDELQARKICLQGLSRDGHPVMIIRASKHYPSKDQAQLKKFIVHVLDKTIASGFTREERGDEKLIGIMDLQNITYRNVDVRALITGFQLLQSYYPERLAKCYILHMPGFFERIWKMVSRFLEKATLQKINIVMNEEERKKFVEAIGEEVLPEEYGGRRRWVAIQDVVLPPVHS